GGSGDCILDTSPLPVADVRPGRPITGKGLPQVARSGNLARPWAAADARGVRMRLRTSVGIAIGTALGTLLAAKALRSRRAVDFKGRTVVIFGGSRGLGLAMAREFSTAGAHVVLAARDEEELERAAADIERQGGSVTTISCDITDRGQINRTIGRIAHDR